MASSNASSGFLPRPSHLQISCQSPCVVPFWRVHKINDGQHVSSVPRNLYSAIFVMFRCLPWFHFSNSAVQGCSPFQAPLCLSWVHAYLWVNQQDYHNFDTLSIQGAPWRLDFGICGLHVHFAILCLEKAREKANMLHVEAGVSNLRMCCLTSGPGKDKGVGEKLPVEVKALKMRTMTRLMESRWREN